MGLLQAQNNNGLIIEYNLFTDEIIYKADGKIINKPYVKKGENITVIVKEFNPYITKAVVAVDQISYNQSSGTLNPTELSMGAADNFSFLGDLMGGLSMGSDVGSEYDYLPSARGASSKDIIESKNTFSTLTSKLAQVESQLNQSYNKLVLFEQAQKSRNLAVTDIAKLKTNANIKPSRVKELIEEEIQYAFAKQKHEKIGIDDLIDEMKKEEEIKSSISNYESAQTDYKALASEWGRFSTRLNIVQGAEDDQLKYIYTSTDSIVDVMQENVNKFGDFKISDKLNYVSADHQAAMAELRQIYEELQDNSFSYSFPPIQAEGDEVSLAVSFSKRNETDMFENYKNLNQTIPVSGGYKITGGVGLAFGGFSSPTYQYSVINGTIVADEKDDFIPVIASFAHFYKQSLSSVNIGGSFGVGLPILGGNTIQSASFFLGPTILVGQKQRLLITGGVMGAKVERLSSGFKAGDSFDGFTEILPLTQKYEIGYFVAVSFNVF